MIYTVQYRVLNVPRTSDFLWFMFLNYSSKCCCVQKIRNEIRFKVQHLLSYNQYRIIHVHQFKTSAAVNNQVLPLKNNHWKIYKYLIYLQQDISMCLPVPLSVQSCPAQEQLLFTRVPSFSFSGRGGWLLGADSWDFLHVQKSTKPREVSLHIA